MVRKTVKAPPPLHEQGLRISKPRDRNTLQSTLGVPFSPVLNHWRGDCFCACLLIMFLMGGKKSHCNLLNWLLSYFQDTSLFFCHWCFCVSHPYTYLTPLRKLYVFSAGKGYCYFHILCIDLHLAYTQIFVAVIYCQQIINQYGKLIQLYVKIQYEYLRLSIMY